MRDAMKLDLDEIAASFGCEVAEVGGEPERMLQQDGRLYMYAQFPQERELAFGDRVQAGIAMRANGSALGIHPYLVRLASGNGFVMARVLEAQPMLLQEFAGPALVKFAIGQAVRVCTAEDVLDYAIDRLSASSQVSAFSGRFSIDVSLMLGRPTVRPHLARIMERVSLRGDDSCLGLADGIAETAQSISDPEASWQLEQLAGELAVLGARSTTAPLTQLPQPEPVAIAA